MEKREGDTYLLASLLSIRSRVKVSLEQGRRPMGGICFMLGQDQLPKHVRYYCWARLYNLFLKWPNFSGHPDYPVPSADPHQHPMEAFDENSVNGILWIGTYGASRMQLLEWMISELEATVNVPE